MAALLAQMLMEAYTLPLPSEPTTVPLGARLISHRFESHMNQQAIVDRPDRADRARAPASTRAAKILRAVKATWLDDFVALLFGRAAPGISGRL